MGVARNIHFLKKQLTVSVHLIQWALNIGGRAWGPANACAYGTSRIVMNITIVVSWISAHNGRLTNFAG